MMMSLIVTLPNAPTSAESFASGRIADGVSAAAPPSVPVVHEIRAQSTTVFTFVIALRRMPERRAPRGRRSRSAPTRSGRWRSARCRSAPNRWARRRSGPRRCRCRRPCSSTCSRPRRSRRRSGSRRTSSTRRAAGSARGSRRRAGSREGEAAEDRAASRSGRSSGPRTSPPRRVRVDVRERQGLDRDVRPEQRRPVDRQGRQLDPVQADRADRHALEPDGADRDAPDRDRGDRDRRDGTEPIGTEPMGTLPIGTLPMGTEPIGIEPTGPVPGEPENAGSCDPGTADSGTSCAATGRTRRSLVSSIVGSASPSPSSGSVAVKQRSSISSERAAGRSRAGSAESRGRRAGAEEHRARVQARGRREDADLRTGRVEGTERRRQRRLGEPDEVEATARCPRSKLMSSGMPSLPASGASVWLKSGSAATASAGTRRCGSRASAPRVGEVDAEGRVALGGYAGRAVALEVDHGAAVDGRRALDADAIGSSGAAAHGLARGELRGAPVGGRRGRGDRLAARDGGGEGRAGVDQGDAVAVRRRRSTKPSQRAPGRCRWRRRWRSRRGRSGRWP